MFANIHVNVKVNTKIVSFAKNNFDFNIYVYVKVKVISVAKENKNQDNIGTNICGRIPTDDTEFEQRKKTKTEFKFILSFKLGFLS
jgi:hypothetical protein